MAIILLLIKCGYILQYKHFLGQRKNELNFTRFISNIFFLFSKKSLGLFVLKVLGS